LLDGKHIQIGGEEGTTVTLSADNKKDTDNNPSTPPAETDTVTITSDTQDATIKVTGYTNNTKQKRHKVTNISVDGTTEECYIVGPASGTSTDPEPATVLMGTDRGVASITTTPGQTATQMRDALVIELVALGINASAVGSDGVAILMQPADGGGFEFGSSDTEVDLVFEAE
jgi:hypothetical protein